MSLEIYGFSFFFVIEMSSLQMYTGTVSNLQWNVYNRILYNCWKSITPSLNRWTMIQILVNDLLKNENITYNIYIYHRSVIRSYLWQSVVYCLSVPFHKTEIWRQVLRHTSFLNILIFFIFIYLHAFICLKNFLFLRKGKLFSFF